MNDLTFQTVPCNGCTKCCHNDAVRILPHEDATRWQTEPHPARQFGPGTRMLAHKPNGDCVYLGPAGCTIQDAKPQICGEMDCRNVARAITWTQARKMPGLPMDVWRKGRDLLKAGK